VLVLAGEFVVENRVPARGGGTEGPGARQRLRVANLYRRDEHQDDSQRRAKSGPHLPGTPL